MPVLDLYDDPSAHVLRQHLARTGGELNEKLAAMAPDEGAALADIPDRLFALVGTHGGTVLRKYAMHDQEHLATSILYFLECGGHLPEPLRAKVAMRLIEGCGWYETPPPLALTKVAVLGAVMSTGAVLSRAPEKVRQQQQQQLMDDYAMRQAQAGIKTSERAHSTSDENEAHKALDAFIRGESSPTAQQYAAFGDHYINPFDDPQHLVKEANSAGTELHSFGALSDDPRAKTPAKRFAVSPKVSGAEEIEFRVPQEVSENSRHYALPDRSLYPIDTVEEVKRASVYFDEYHRDFTMDDRRLFAQSVALRAEQLDVPVGSSIQKLAGSVYGPNISAELKGRILAYEGTGKEAAYEVLLEQLDATPPIVMYDMLKMADEASGADASYGRAVTGFKDPLSAVFGAPEKPIYTWCAKGAYVTEEQLRSFSKLVPDLDKVMGEGFSNQYVDDPVKSFDKLPESKKIILARLANGEAFRWL